MMIRLILNFLLGYVQISIEGYFIERFINICMSKRILLWNLKRKKSSFLYANIGMRDFKKIKQIAKTTKCRIKIEEKKGLPFLWHRYKKRKIFVFLLFIILGGMVCISNFIWNIEIVGNTNIPTEEIIKALEKDGLKTGMLKQKVDTKLIISNLRLERNDIAWVGIKLEGTNAVVEIVEADQKPEIIDEQDYCNLVSNKQGIITKVNAQNGTALVKEGDIVKQGTLLIGGWLEGKYTGTRYVHVKGEVEAKVWYSKQGTINLKQQEKQKTGRQEKRYYFTIHNLTINLSKKLPNFKNYDTINENQKLKLFSNFYFPIQFGKTIYTELEDKEVEYTIEEAKEKLTKQLEEELKKEITDPSKIVNQQINTKEENGVVEVELIYEVLEKIGTKEKILF